MSQCRLLAVSGVLLALAAAGGLMAVALRDAVVYYRAPSQLAGADAVAGQRIRVGGVVEAGSVAREGHAIRFVVADRQARLPVVHAGVLPELFREGQDVVVEGRLDGQGLFHASAVLVRHDAAYRSATGDGGAR